MYFNLGKIPKGMRQVLDERGVNTHGMKAEKMRETLGSHSDFKNEKSSVERHLGEEKEHIVYMLPKYHCELNRLNLDYTDKRFEDMSWFLRDTGVT